MVLRTVTEDAVLRGGGGGLARVGRAGKAKSSTTELMVRARNLVQSHPSQDSRGRGRLALRSSSRKRRRCCSSSRRARRTAAGRAAAPLRARHRPARRRGRHGAPHHVRAAGDHLLAGAAAPDADSLALHCELRPGARPGWWERGAGLSRRVAAVNGGRGEPRSSCHHWCHPPRRRALQLPAGLIWPVRSLGCTALPHGVVR
jgi:hypothetical protein